MDKHDCDELCRLISGILAGIDETETDSETGWWETSQGAEFGAAKMRQIQSLLKRYHDGN